MIFFFKITKHNLNVITTITTVTVIIIIIILLLFVYNYYYFFKIIVLSMLPEVYFLGVVAYDESVVEVHHK